MHLIRLDIDRKNSPAHLQAGPFGGGLNAVYAPIHGGSSTMSRFVRSVLFRGNYVNEVFETDEGETIDGSMQWVDSSGHVRMMSFAGGSAMLPGGFVHSPLHPSQRPLHREDSDRIRGLGNIFWEGDDGDARWDELRADILGMIFCSPLGSVSPEKLWWSASRLGVHSPARNELDEGYQRLKSEEQELLDRLRNADAVDHDRAWWALERDRILAEIHHVVHGNHQANHANEKTNQSVLSGLRERYASIQVELSNLRTMHQDLLVAEANSKLDAVSDCSHSEHVSIYGAKRDPDSMPRLRTERPVRADLTSEIHRVRSRIEKLVAEQADVESQMKSATVVPVMESSHRWDDSQLRQQLSHAEEMLRRWDRRSQWHRRLAEVQSHLKTRSPYRRTSEGSLIPFVEKYLRELTAGAARQLPPWAVEASYLRGHEIAVDFENPSNQYGNRGIYYDRRLPSAESRQRRLVDMAIRLAIAEAAVHRIGRIPFLFDNSLEIFRGESLEQVLHVLAGFARDGRQVLLATNDEFVARRIAAHGGTVSRMHEILRYARPGYVMDSTSSLGIHPSLASQPSTGFATDGQYYGSWNRAGFVSGEYSDINYQLNALANEQAANGSWWSPETQPPRPAVRPVPLNHRRHKFHLHLDSSIDDVPTVDNALAARFQHAGVHRVGDLIRSTSESLSAAMHVDADVIHYLQCLAELMTSTPQLRAFDARVLVGCGITRSHMLRDLGPYQLVDRVDRYLRSSEGLELLANATPFEAARIREWLDSMRRRTYASHDPTNDRGSRLSQEDQTRKRRRKKSRLRAYEPEEPAISVERKQRSRRDSVRGSSQWKFHLDVDSPVVDAPAIGPKMAAKLEAIGIHTVGGLLGAKADAIATRLAEKSVTEQLVAEWQRQAMMVCRVPNLRGHDAQLIVGTGLQTAEELANQNLATYFEKVVQFASSKAGLRILRGTEVPSRDEVQDWIHWAQNCRAFRAA